MKAEKGFASGADYPYLGFSDMCKRDMFTYDDYVIDDVRYIEEYDNS